VLVMATVAAGLVAAAAPAAAEASDGMSSATTVRLDPAAGVIRVVTDVTITNTAQNEYRAGSVVYPYLFAVSYPIPAGVANLTATSSGGMPLSVRTEPLEEEDLFQLAAADLAANLYSGETTVVRLAYDLPSQPQRSPSPVRVNPAYVSFPLVGVGEAGRISVDVEVPGGFEVRTFGDEMTEAPAGAATRWSVKPAETDDGQAYVFFTARNDALLDRRDIDVGGRQVQLQGWPGDTAWMDFAHKTVRDALPILEEIVGRPWPVDGPLELAETASNGLDGYAGVYKVFEDDIEVTEELDSHVLVHELSHAWFNRELFEERWVNEGLAEAVTVLVLEELDLPPREREAPDRASSASVPLREWTLSGFRRRTPAAETFGYAASQKVLTEMIDEIGAERLASVLAAADEGYMAYQASSDGTETSTAVDDWRRVLDLFEEAGATNADTLFRIWVVPSGDLQELETRRVTRDAYAKFRAEDPWLPPRVVRDHLDRWRFEAAVEAMEQARAVLAERDELVTTLDELGLDLDASIRTSYEQAVTGFDATSGLISTQAEAASRIAEVSAAVAAPRNRLQQLGLWGNPVEPALSEAQAAFNRTEFEESERLLSDIEKRLAASEAVGRGRAAWAGICLAVALLLLLTTITLLIRRTRRRRRARTAAPPPPPPSLPGPVTVDMTGAWPAATPPTNGSPAIAAPPASVGGSPERGLPDPDGPQLRVPPEAPTRPTS
jgi:hypothetical protein